MYDLPGVLDGARSVPPGTNLLVASHDEQENRDRILDALATGIRDGEGAVVITTDLPASQIVEALEARVSFEPRLLTIVDCSGEQTETTAEDLFVYTVASPTELTATGIGVVECFDQLSQRGVDRCRVGLLSLSSMVGKSGEAEIFKFSHVVSSRLDSAGFLGLFAIDTDEVDTQSFQIISEAFDDTV